LLTNEIASGFRKGHGKRPSSNPTVRQKVYNDARKYSSSFIKSANTQESKLNGTGKNKL
jgi:hypothetical protein